MKTLLGFDSWRQEGAAAAMTGLATRVAFFIAFLVPVVIDQYSVNYTFVLYAAYLAWQAKRLERPPSLMIAAMAVYAAVYAISAIIDMASLGDIFFRRSASFVIFMSVFVFAFVRFGEQEVRAFKLAVIIISLAFCIYSLLEFYSVGGNGRGYALKDVVGSQRYGFVYLLALACLAFYPLTNRWLLLARIVTGLLIMAGLLLTFSRSSIVALGCVLPLIIIEPLLRHSADAGRRVLVRAGIALACAVVLFATLPVAFSYYNDLMFARYTAVVESSVVGDTATVEKVFVPEGSEGTRLQIWKAITQHTLANPILGSGYLGSWTLDSVTTGSSHNQYLDVLMRTGLPGTLFYLIILCQVAWFLWKNDQGLFWGLLAVLVYGLFHETFKESQGAFILACLIGMYASHKRDGVRSETDD